MGGYIKFVLIFAVFSAIHSRYFSEPERTAEPVRYFVSYSHRSGFGNICVEFANGGAVAGVDEVRKIEQYIKLQMPSGFDTSSIVILNIQPFPIQ